MIHMLSALMEIMDDLQEQIGNMCRAGNSKKEPKGNQRNFFKKAKEQNKSKEFLFGGTLSLQWKCVRKKNRQP